MSALGLALPGPPLAVSGALAFARFAAPPNALGLCGGPDHVGLVGHLGDGLDGPDLVELCRAFEGAWPYLTLIAEHAGGGQPRDPLDPEVVEAYWIGNELLQRVPVPAFRAHLESRFRGRTERSEWPWLATKPADGAVPHHSFHVLEVMPRIGLLREGRIAAVLPAMERCLVRPATVVESGPNRTIVAAPPLMLSDGSLRLGLPIDEEIKVGPSLAATQLWPGDLVAVHWGWACDRLGRVGAAWLDRMNRRALRLANRTI